MDVKSVVVPILVALAIAGMGALPLYLPVHRQVERGARAKKQKMLPRSRPRKSNPTDKDSYRLRCKHARICP